MLNRTHPTECDHLAVRRHNSSCIQNLRQFYIFFLQNFFFLLPKARRKRCCFPHCQGQLSVWAEAAHPPTRQMVDGSWGMSSVHRTHFAGFGECSCHALRMVTVKETASAFQEPLYREPCALKGCLGSLEHWIGTCIFKLPELCENMNSY